MSKKTLSLKKEVQKFDRKWTAIYLALIFLNSLLTIIHFYSKHYLFALLFLAIAIWDLFYLINHKLEIKELKTIEREYEKLSRENDRIIKEITELEQHNQKLKKNCL